MRLFSSRVRLEVILFFITHPHESIYVRELARELDGPSGAIGRELVNLEKAGLLTSRMLGKQKYFELNRQFPIIDDLKNIFTKMMVTDDTGSDTGKHKKTEVILTDDERAVIEAIGDEGAFAEEIITQTGLSAAVVLQQLVILEIKSYISKHKKKGKFFRNLE